MNERLKNQILEDFVRTKKHLAYGHNKVCKIDIQQISLDERSAWKYYYLIEIKNHLGEQKIDLGLCDEDSLKKDPFFQSVLPDAIKL